MMTMFAGATGVSRAMDARPIQAGVTQIQYALAELLRRADADCGLLLDGDGNTIAAVGLDPSEEGDLSRACASWLNRDGSLSLLAMRNRRLTYALIAVSAGDHADAHVALACDGSAAPYPDTDAALRYLTRAGLGISAAKRTAGEAR